MITYGTFAQIHHLHHHDKLTVTQIAQQLNLDARTVNNWLAQESYKPFKTPVKPSKLDSFKQDIIRWLEVHPGLSARQIYQRLDQMGYEGGQTIVTNYVRKIRPPKRKAYLTLSFAPGECAQVDWGNYGSIKVENTTRRLSFFVMVLCHSRQMYVEFTVMERMEHFLQCHINAFNYFQGVPQKVMVDNLKTAVLKHPYGDKADYHPRYIDFANHYGFEAVACQVYSPHEKGMVESAVGYVKSNFLNGLELSEFKHIHPAAKRWIDEVANVRIHSTTKRRPADMWKDEIDTLGSLPQKPYDVGIIAPVKAGKNFRISVDTNAYSVPHAYASQILTLKRYPERLCIYHEQNLIATHARLYGRNSYIENPDHVKTLLDQRKRAKAQKRYQAFLALCTESEAYYKGLEAKRLNPHHHVQKVMALVEIYGNEKVVRALRDATELQAFSSEYIANILEQRERHTPRTGALHLTRNEDLLDIEIPEPDLTLYDQDDNTATIQLKQNENNQDEPNTTTQPIPHTTQAPAHSGELPKPCQKSSS